MATGKNISTWFGGQWHRGDVMIMRAADPNFVRFRNDLAARGVVVVGVEFRNGGGSAVIFNNHAQICPGPHFRIKITIDLALCQIC